MQKNPKNKKNTTSSTPSLANEISNSLTPIGPPANRKWTVSAIATMPWFIVLWSLMLTLWLYLYSVRQGGVPCWDEFERCAWASHIWYGIRHLDFFHLWKHTHAQMVWPPLHSWITGILFVLFDPSLASARLFSLAAFMGSGILIFFWFARRRDTASIVCGLIAWSLYSTAPIVIQQAVGIMSEGVGLFLALLVLISLPPKDNEESSRWALSGFLLGMFFLYKYNYAFLTYAGLFISRYFQMGASLRKMWNKKDILLFGFPILLMVLWFIPSMDEKWNNLVYFVVNNPSARQPWGFSTLFYYPQVIPHAYFVLPWVSVACLALVFIASPIGWRLTLRNPAAACCVIHFIAVAIHPMKMERFQFITLGLFFILTGEALRTLLVFGFQNRPRWGDLTAWGLGLAILAPTLFYQTDVFRQAKIPQKNPFITPVHAVVDSTSESDRIALFITHEHASPPAMTFYLIAGKDFLQRDLRTNIAHWNHIFLFAQKDAVLALSEEERMRNLEYELYLAKSNKIVVIETTAPEWIDIFPRVFAGVQEYIHLIPKLSNYQLVYEKKFPHARAKVRIFTLKPNS